MALSRSYVRCSLCQGNVSIIAGNLDKLKSHLENQHDVFHHLDFQIAINFLEDFEKEDLISKLLPRMKVVFEGAKVPGKRSRDENEMELEVEAKKEKIETDLDRDEEKEEEENNVYEDSSDDNFEIVTDENPDGQSIKQDPKTSQDKKGPNVKEVSLKAEKEEEDKGNEKDTQDGGKEDKDCIDGSKKEESTGVETPSKPGIIRKSPRKSVPSRKVFKLTKTPTPRKESVVVATKNNNNNFRTAVTICPRCQKEMLKRNLRRHLRVVHGQEPPSHPDLHHQLLLFKCKICSAGFASRDDLGLHTSEVHTLNIEDVEAMALTEDDQGGLFEAVRDEINFEVLEDSSGQGSVRDK